ncbi:MAG: VWA domain-containing protein [Lachnospiraceae bacterium]|jgi:uncharacterized protein YegL|nr:VWA domain-containing protein [Lachnospiraceae bacterium]
MNKEHTELVFILDRSGSMGGLESDTIGGFNAMLMKQRALKGECRITTVLFNSELTVLHDRIDIEAVQPITEKEYAVGGCTALLDAIGTTIDRIVKDRKKSPEGYRAGKVMFVIITDGLENSSREYSSKRIRQKISEQKEKYGWEFIFLGADLSAVETADDLGISRNRATVYNSDHAGTRLNYEVMSEAAAQFRTNGMMDEDCLAPIREDAEKRRGRKEECKR